MDDYVNIVDVMFFSIIAIYTWIVERMFNKSKQEFHYYITKYPNKKFYWQIRESLGEETKYLIHEENYERSE